MTDDLEEQESGSAVGRRRWSEECVWKDCRQRGREGGAGSSDAPSGGWRLLEKEKTEYIFLQRSIWKLL
jgi:hypothetical protein